jgi:hypothetical protein
MPRAFLVVSRFVCLISSLRAVVGSICNVLDAVQMLILVTLIPYLQVPAHDADLLFGHAYWVEMIEEWEPRWDPQPPLTSDEKKLITPRVTSILTTGLDMLATQDQHATSILPLRCAPLMHPLDSSSSSSSSSSQSGHGSTAEGAGPTFDSARQQ